eukprot:738634-Amorphochlora_amoeboformis.AAC.1
MEKRQQRQKERQAMYQHQQAQITKKHFTHSQERIAKERVRKIEKQERKFDRTINQIGHTLQFVK